MKNLLLKVISYKTAERIKTAIAFGFYYSGIACLSDRFRRQGAAILMFHSIGDDRSFSDNRLPAARFEQVVSYLSKNWEIVPVSRIVAAIEKGEEPSSRWVALTFDDGYADNARVALPILEKYGAKATFFLPAGVLDGTEFDAPTRLFYDEIERMLLSAPARGPVALRLVNTRLDLASERTRTESAKRLILEIREKPPAEIALIVAELTEALNIHEAPSGRLYLTWDDARRLEGAGMDIGSHSISHAWLSALPRAAMLQELNESKRRLDARLSRRVDGFAFPFGKPDSIPVGVAVDLKTAGYRYALTTNFGRARPGAALFDLPRIAVEDAAVVRLKVELSGIRL